jgi:hypothetical protein
MKQQLAAADQSDLRTSIEQSLLLMRASFRGPDLAEALVAKSAGRAPEFGPA